jgi:hypothetical protein
MRKNAVAAAFLALVLPLFAETPPSPAQPKESQVTIPLDQYEVLRRGSESPSTTVVDTILLGGRFRERDLTIAFSGRTTGTRPLLAILEQTHDVTISACKGDAIVARSGKGAFNLIPLAETFSVQCELRISGSDRLRMHATPGVLAVRSSVADAELVAGDEDDNGARDYTLVRHVAGPGETLAATATGRYLITLLPDASRFRYAIDVHNPNRTTSSLELALQSNEHLQQIDSAAPYEVSEGRYVFSIPPGDSTITLTGELRGSAFIAPVRASLQYLVLESHPLLRPTVRTPAKRISLGETGVTPQYRGAVAFETGTERIAWEVTRLQALHSTGYAVNDATHRVFVPVDGPVLGESTFAVRNEGAPELVLPSKPEPTYVSLGGEAVLMTKNAAGQLTVPLSQGEQQTLVQHRQPLWRGAGFAVGRVAIPQLTVPATNTNLTLSYPAQWVPLYENFASRARFWTPEAGDIALFLALALWLERLLAWLGLPPRRRLPIALPAALASTLVTSFLALVVIACAVLTIGWILTQPLRPRIGYAVVFAGALGIGLLYLMVSSKGGGYAKYDYESAVTSTERVVTDTAGAPADADRPPAALAYQGLPAKFDLPSGHRSNTFSQELMRVDRPQTASILAISFALTNWLGVLIALASLALLWRDRCALAEGWRGRFGRVEA